jgi:DNA-binding NarL/FixJ family response regulator
MMLVSQPTEAGQPPDGGKMARILIADDHAMMRKGLRAVIEAHPGWSVCAESATGLEALEQTTQEKPDMVILDVSMPGLNGLEAAHRISKSMPQVRILLFTMHRSTQFLKDVTKAGAHGYVCKSSEEDILTEAMETVLRGETFFSSDKMRANSQGSGAV